MLSGRIPDIVLVLPLPPSANKSWQPGLDAKGSPMMFRRKPYRDWMKQASWEVVAQRGGDCVEREYAIRIVLPVTARDPDNSIKGLQDACQHGGALANDKHMRRLVLDVDPERKQETALIELWSLA